MLRLIFRISLGLLAPLVLSAGPSAPMARAQVAAERQDEQTPARRKLLHDPAPEVRLRTALALAEAHDAEAIPVLIDLLAELTAQQRRPVEAFLQQLAGEWAPAVNFAGEDEIARKIRRNVWAAWWKNIEGQSLLTALRKRTRTAEDRETIRDLLGKLGSDGFAARQRASRELFALGRRSLPQLQEALQGKDAEVVRQVKMLIERIEREPHLPSAVVRLLSVCKPAGSVEALLAYLPFAEDENVADVQASLAALALREGKLDAALVRAAKEPDPQLRAAATEALAQGGGAEGVAEARKRLQDEVPTVRLRAALALAMARERSSVPVLIDLLPVLSGEHVGQVEDALHQLAGDTAPKESLGTEPAEKEKYRDAWAAWWKDNADRVDLAQLTRPQYGYTLVCDNSTNRVFEVDRNGKERWAIKVKFPRDAWVLPGNRVLIAEHDGRSRITERDFKGTVLWSMEGLPPVANVQRLGNGNTFIVAGSQIFEVDRNSKEVYAIKDLPGGARSAYRARNGNIIAVAGNGECMIMDTTGKQLKSFPCNVAGIFGGSIDLLPNGHILITQSNRKTVAEYDMEGKLVREVDVPTAAWSTATGLPNGHILVGSTGGGVFEVDRTGKTVWALMGTLNCGRARRR